jgi:lysozyme
MRPIPDAAVEFVRRHEGCVLRVYDDLRPRAALKPGDPALGALTAGFGHTGPELRIDMVVTRELAEAWLEEDLRTAAARLYRRIGGVADDLTVNQYAAMLSFVFNLGVDGPMATATIWKRLRARKFDQVPLEMMKFVHAQGRKLQGLVERRAAEVALWSSAEPGSAPGAPPSSVTRLAETPATPSEPEPARKSVTVWAAATSAATAAFASVKDWISQAIDFVTPDHVNQLSGAITPYAAKSHLVEGAVSVLAVAAAVLSALLVVRKHNEARR